MARTYIVAPNFAMGPGSLSLGDILVDPLAADLDPLNFESRLAIEPANLFTPSIVKDFESTRKALLSGRFGFWAACSATLGVPVGAELGLFLERNSNDTIKTEELVTQEFRATDKYVKDVMENPDVKHYIKGRNYKVPLYMVTGLKLAKGVSVNHDVTREMEAKAGISASGGCILDVKPLLEVIRKRTEGVSYQSTTDFILAFRVRRIVFEQGVPKHTLSQKGASMMDGSPQIHEAPEMEMEPEISWKEIEENASIDGIRILKVQEDDLTWVVSEKETL